MDRLLYRVCESACFGISNWACGLTLNERTMSILGCCIRAKVVMLKNDTNFFHCAQRMKADLEIKRAWRFSVC